MDVVTYYFHIVLVCYLFAKRCYHKDPHKIISSHNDYDVFGSN